MVYVWRSCSRAKLKGWIGPGLVVCVNSAGSSIWVSMRGVLVKCNVERVRLATDSEWLGAELIKVLSADAKQHLERAGQRGFVDATSEEGPTEQDAEPEQMAMQADSLLHPGTPLDPILEEVEPAASDVSTVEPNVGRGVVRPGADSSSSGGTSSSESSPVKVRKQTVTRSVRPRLNSDIPSPVSSVAADIRTEDTSLSDAAGGPATPSRQPSKPGSSASHAPPGGWLKA